MKKLLEKTGLWFKSLFNKIKNLSVKTKLILAASAVFVVALAITSSVLVKKYKNKAVTVSFDSVYGTEVKSVSLKRGDSYVPSEDAVVPERPGLVFTGWYLDKDAKKPYNGEPIKKNTTLYAGYSPLGYSISGNLGDLPANTAFTLFSTEKIGSSMLSDYLTFSVLNGQPVTLSFTESTGKNSSGYYYKITPDIPFSTDGIYRLELEKPVKAWITEVNGRPVSDKTSDIFTFTVGNISTEAVSFESVENTSELYNSAATAALVNSVFDSLRAYLKEYSANSANAFSFPDELSLICAATFGIGPEQYVSANSAKPAGYTFTCTGLEPVFTKELVNGLPKMGFELTPATLSFGKPGEAKYTVMLSLTAADTYSVFSEAATVDGTFESMSDGYYRTVINVDSSSILNISVKIEIPGSDVIEFTPVLNNPSENLSKIPAFVPNTSGDSSGAAESNSDTTDVSKPTPSESDLLVIAQSHATFAVKSAASKAEDAQNAEDAQGTEDAQNAENSATLVVNYVISLNSEGITVSNQTSNCNTEYFVTNGLRSTDDTSAVSDILTYERPVYGKRILTQQASVEQTAGSAFNVLSELSLQDSNISAFCVRTGINSDFELFGEATFMEDVNGLTYLISDFRQPLCAPKKAEDVKSETAAYLAPGESTLVLHSHFLDLTDIFGGNGTRVAGAVEQPNLPSPSDVKILVKNADIPYYTIGAGEFTKSDKAAASLIQVSNGKVYINSSVSKAAFDLVIVSKDTTLPADAEDFSDAKVIHVVFEPRVKYDPCRVVLFDTEGVELFSGNFNTGDIVSVDFDSSNHKAQFMIYAHYQTSNYQPSTLAFYDEPMGTEGNRYSGLLSLSGDTNLYLSLMPNFSQVEWFCRYGTETENTVKATTSFRYAGAATELVHPDLPEITTVPGDYSETEYKILGFTDNYTIIDGKYKRYTPVGYIEMSKSTVSYKVNVFVKYPDSDEPVEFGTLTGRYDTDFIFPKDFIAEISKTCEIIGFCRGEEIPAGITPDTYAAWASEQDIFASPSRDESEVSYCALVRYRPGIVNSVFVTKDSEIVQQRTSFETAHITVEDLIEKAKGLPQVEYALHWNEKDSAYDIFKFTGYSNPTSDTTDDGYVITSTILGIYKYVGRTDVANVDFTSENGIKIVSRDLLENPEAEVIREQLNDFNYRIIGSSGYVNGTEISPSDVSFVAPALDIPEEYKYILKYVWVDDKNPGIELEPDTEYSMSIVPADGLKLHPVFDEARVVELTVSDGTITESVFVFGQKGSRLNPDDVIAAAQAANPALKELSSEQPFPVYFFGSKDSPDNPTLIDTLTVSFKHLLKQVRLHTGEGGPFEDNTVLQVIEGEPDTPIKESAAKKIKELVKQSTSPAYIRGYTFLGFAETENGEPKPLSSYTYSDQDLYAVYSKYTKWGITFKAGEGTFPDGSTEVTVYALDGSFPELPSAPSVSGKAFTGWTNSSGLHVSPERTEARSSVTYYAAYDFNTFSISLHIGRVSCVYDGKVHSPEITVSGLPAGYTCSVSADVSAKDVTGTALTVGYKNLVILDNKGNDVTSRARVTTFYGSLEIKPATLTITTDSIMVPYVNEYSHVIGTGTCQGAASGDFIDFKLTGFIDFFNTSNPSLAEWQRSFFLEHGFVEAKNTWQIDWSTSNAKQSNYVIVEKEIGTLRMAKRTTITYKCNNAFLLKAGNVNEARSLLLGYANAGTLADEAFTCTFELDSGSKLTMFDFPYIWTYKPYFESDDTNFYSSSLKQLTGSDIRSITVQRTSDGVILGEFGLDHIWSFTLDDNYTFRINLNEQ